MLTQLAVSEPYLTRHKTEENQHCFTSCTGLVQKLESLRTGGLQGGLAPFHTSVPTRCKGQALRKDPCYCDLQNHIMQSCLEISPSPTKKKTFPPHLFHTGKAVTESHLFSP